MHATTQQHYLFLFIFSLLTALFVTHPRIYIISLRRAIEMTHQPTAALK